MHKKGYYFSVEATLGILILSSAFFIVLFFVESPGPIPDYRYAENIAGYLGNVYLGEFCSDGCVGYSIGELELDNYTLIDVIGYRYSQSLPDAIKITNDIIIKGELLLRGKNIALVIKSITCDILYPVNPPEEISCEEGTNETKEVVFRKIIQGYVLDKDSGELNFWGDYVFEVRVW